MNRNLRGSVGPSGPPGPPRKRDLALARPPPPATLHVGFFGRTLPVIAAKSKGFFAAEGLTVSFLRIASSTQAFAGLH